MRGRGAPERARTRRDLARESCGLRWRAACSRSSGRPGRAARSEIAMGYFGRFTSGVVARIDELIARVENHEALADAALCELQSATARGQARHARVRRDGDALRKALAGEQQAVTQWRERALRQTDE